MTVTAPARQDRRLLQALRVNLLIGVVFAQGFLVALMVFDVGGLRTMVATSSAGPLALVMLSAVLSLTWGSAAMGTAIFLLPKAPAEDGRPPRGRRRRYETRPLAPASVFARAARR